MNKENGVIIVDFPKDQIDKEYGVALTDSLKNHLVEVTFDEERINPTAFVKALNTLELEPVLVSKPITKHYNKLKKKQ